MAEKVNDFENLNDQELRTKCLEYGLPDVRINASNRAITVGRLIDATISSSQKEKTMDVPKTEEMPSTSKQAKANEMLRLTKKAEGDEDNEDRLESLSNKGLKCNGLPYVQVKNSNDDELPNNRLFSWITESNQTLYDLKGKKVSKKTLSQKKMPPFKKALMRKSVSKKGSISSLSESPLSDEEESSAKSDIAKMTTTSVGLSTLGLRKVRTSETVKRKPISADEGQSCSNKAEPGRCGIARKRKAAYIVSENSTDSGEEPKAKQITLKRTLAFRKSDKYAPSKLSGKTTGSMSSLMNEEPSCSYIALRMRAADNFSDDSDDFSSSKAQRSQTPNALTSASESSQTPES